MKPPKRTVASPVLSCSDTLYFCCLRSKVWLPCRVTSHTRLDYICQSELSGEHIRDPQIRSAKIKCQECPAINMSIVCMNFRYEDYSHPVSVPSGTPVTNVGLIDINKRWDRHECARGIHHGERVPVGAETLRDFIKKGAGDTFQLRGRKIELVFNVGDERLRGIAA